MLDRVVIMRAVRINLDAIARVAGGEEFKGGTGAFFVGVARAEGDGRSQLFQPRGYGTTLSAERETQGLASRLFGDPPKGAARWLTRSVTRCTRSAYPPGASWTDPRTASSCSRSAGWCVRTSTG